MNSFDKPHVVAVPFPAFGHAIPFLDLVKLLASHGLTVTCVTTAANAGHRLQQQLAHAISGGLDIRVLVLPTPSVEGLPEGLESFDQVPTEQCYLIFELVAKLEESFNVWLEDQLSKDWQQGTGPLVCVMHDVILGWTMEVPRKHNIPIVVFDTYGAFGLSVLHSAWLSSSRNVVEKEGESIVLSLDLPRTLRLDKHEIDPFLFEPSIIAFMGRLESVYESSGMLVNTFEQLEPEYLQQLRKRTGKKVWSIGPLLPANVFSGAVKTSARGKMTDISEKELLEWLDSQSPSSVVYISFGSQVFLSEEQSKALASGLEATGQPFIWVIKACPKIEPGTSDRPLDPPCMYLPEGFKERTRNRGLVIWGWAPQLLILSHPSLGAFMSHCGWNSMLESVTFGVPLITWPMHVDQHFNSKLAVKLGIGIQVCENRGSVPEKQRVEEGVTRVFSRGEGTEMKSAAEKLKHMARKAVADGGTSNANLKDFVSDMFKLHKGRKGVACGDSRKLNCKKILGIKSIS
ncbi:hypothetical protein SUGI_0073530 [Cryptomeria japonica]|uniref:scopoletin glucosyltransferase n=1 Tax=Cryptomeria japonica TaxID=3369 RepID=UPI002408B1DA|nr:scopoletin glucosyltransferase [Cryptomeria japonica]GLJ07746.1 hypothetical protein SUGI_0073530 [Cryptomeria japonica]